MPLYLHYCYALFVSKLSHQAVLYLHYKTQCYLNKTLSATTDIMETRIGDVNVHCALNIIAPYLLSLNLINTSLLGTRKACKQRLITGEE